jgi:hypothetical protein
MGRPAQGLGLALPAVLVAEEEAVLEPAVAGGLYASNSGEWRTDGTTSATAPTLTLLATR